jgi:hypothetical protein
MVKSFHTLALQAIQINRQLSAHLIRVQTGFLRTQNIEQAQETIKSLQDMLHDMQTTLQTPPPNQPSNYVPLK